MSKLNQHVQGYREVFREIHEAVPLEQKMGIDKLRQRRRKS